MTRERFLECLLLYVSELSDRSSPEDQPDMMLVTGKELEDGIALALERSHMRLVPMTPTDKMLADADSAIPRFEAEPDGSRMMGVDGALAAWGAMLLACE